MSGGDVPALFCGSRTLSCVEPRSAMVVMGSFGFVENNGASFEEVGLEECKDRRAVKFRYQNAFVVVGVRYRNSAFRKMGH